MNPSKSFYDQNDDILARARQQKMHNFKITYDPSNQPAGDIKAQPKTIQASDLKSSIEVLNSNSHRVRIGH